MDLGGNGSGPHSSQEVKAFFLPLFDKLPSNALELSKSTDTASPSKSAALHRNLSRQQSVVLFADEDPNEDQLITNDEFVGFLEKVKEYGYSERKIVTKLTSALERGEWRQCTAPARPPAWAAPLPLLPDAPTSAVLPLQALPEPDWSDSDEDELDESVAREWCRLLRVYSESAARPTNSDVEFAPTLAQMLLSPE